MELNVNSPAYFSQNYGVDEDVYSFCQKLYLYFKDKEYSDTLHIIGIIPVVAPREIYEKGLWKERIEMIGNKSCAIITIQMDFDKYYSADGSERILLIKEMILKAVKKIKSKGKFDFEKFEKDFNEVRF
ncbi:MAG: hypothetical protein K2L19_01265 [Eubacterium sp.]|nr:hypothetical protein [Eubacterium sp.]